MMAPMVASLIASMISSLIQFVASSLIIFFHYYYYFKWWKFWEKWLQEQEEDIITWIKIFNSAQSFKKYGVLTISIMNLGYNGVLTRDNLPRVNDGVYVILLNDKQSKRMHSVSLYLDWNTAVHFNSFGNEYILQEVISTTKNESITHSIIRIQDSDSILRRFNCIAFIKYDCWKNFARLCQLNIFEVL